MRCWFNKSITCPSRLESYVGEQPVTGGRVKVGVRVGEMVGDGVKVAVCDIGSVGIIMGVEDGSVGTVEVADRVSVGAM